MLHVVGIRHHSPACARLVAHVIETVRPLHVLIEGPADMNERIGELMLGHTLPVAVFTYLRTKELEGPAREVQPSPQPARRHASWTPFCSYSPEWVALQKGHAQGAEVRFCDLPAWDEAFEGRKNRYADHEDPNARAVSGRTTGARYGEALCRRYGVDDIDTLWDHLFEGECAGEAALLALQERLERYFEHYRNGEPGGPRDAPREELMARFCAWALQDAQTKERNVVLVCGGFHAPFVKQRAAELAAGARMPLPSVAPPADAGDESVRYGSYLVPYGYRRLDSFAGYDAGMPSPQFYELVHEHGPARAAESLLELVVGRLREKKQMLSTADLIAARTSAQALAAMRGHRVLLRTDLLDGLASALVKDGLEQPFPWAHRGPLLPRTHPLLVEVVAALCGDREGKLASGTPRPPLVTDVELELERHALTPSPEPRTVKVSLRDGRGRSRSRVLHRLSVLQIPGFARLSGPAWATDGLLDEVWRISRHDQHQAALIEASLWGATLENAALSRLEDALISAGGRLGQLAAILGSAVFVGIEGLAMQVLERVNAAMVGEQDLGQVGLAVGRLLDVYLHGELLGADAAPALASVLTAAFDRGLWLLEGRTGPEAPLSENEVKAVAGLRDLLLRGPPALRSERDRAEGVLSRRALDRDAPPALRGASLGALWSLAQGAESQEREALAAEATRSASLPERIGDFLGGLFLVARSEALHADALLAAIDEVLGELGDHEFLVSVASLRLAFSFFPPREREILAKKIMARRGAGGSAQQLLRPGVSVAQVSEGLALDRGAAALAQRFGLLDSLDEVPADG